MVTACVLEESLSLTAYELEGVTPEILMESVEFARDAIHLL